MSVCVPPRPCVGYCGKYCEEFPKKLKSIFKKTTKTFAKKIVGKKFLFKINVFTWDYSQFHLKLDLLRPCVVYNGTHCKEFPKKCRKQVSRKQFKKKLQKRLRKENFTIKCFHRELFTGAPSTKTPLCAAA